MICKKYIMMCIICKNIYYHDYFECVVYKSLICIRCLLTINIMNFKYKELHILYLYKCLLCNYFRPLSIYIDTSLYIILLNENEYIIFLFS